MIPGVDLGVFHGFVLFTPRAVASGWTSLQEVRLTPVGSFMISTGWGSCSVKTELLQSRVERAQPGSQANWDSLHPSLPTSLGESSSPTIHVIPHLLPLLKSKQQTSDTNTPTVGSGHGLAVSLIMCVCDTSCAIQSSALGVMWSVERRGPDSGFSE